MTKKIIIDYNSAEHFKEKIREIADQSSNWEARLQRVHNKTESAYAHLLGKRFYISPKKYFIAEAPWDSLRYYLTVELIEYPTKKIYNFDVIHLLRNISAIKPEQYDINRKKEVSYCCDLLEKCCSVESKADVNVSFRERINKIKSNITNMKFVDAFIDLVGSGQIYFSLEHYFSWDKNICRPRFRPDAILSASSFYGYDCYYRRDKKLEYIPGTIYEKIDAIKEIEDNFGEYLDKVLSHREISLPVLAIGLDAFNFSTHNSLICFAKSHKEEDIAWRFYTHYDAAWIKVSPDDTNEAIREIIIDYIFRFFYKGRFKNRIEGSRKYHESK